MRGVPSAESAAQLMRQGRKKWYILRRAFLSARLIAEHLATLKGVRGVISVKKLVGLHARRVVLVIVLWMD